MPSIRLRGIYSSALSALLVEHGWKIVQPSEDLQARIAGAGTTEPFDLQIYDCDERRGVLACGAEIYLQELQELLTEELSDTLFYTAPAPLEAIYVGLVHRRRACGYEIDLGKVMGFLPKDASTGTLRSGTAIRVQVCELIQAGEQAILTTELSLAGRFVVLSASVGVGISKEIKDRHERERLAQLGKRWTSRSYGIIWRTAARGRDPKELQSELVSLRAIFSQLSLSDHPAEGIPGLLYAGTPTLIVTFTDENKRTLDHWRERFVTSAHRKTLA